jgi:phosphoribosylformylglycinamidine (FGAM) synthase PurS component
MLYWPVLTTTKIENKMKDILDNIQLQMSELEKARIQLKKLYISLDARNDKMILNELIILVNKFPSNPVIIHDFILFLLTCNDDDIVMKYNFSDIRTLFISSCKLFEKDIDLNVEYFHFLKNIEDNEEQADQHIKNFKEHILQTINPSK